MSAAPRRSGAAALVLATVAFTACFYAWSLLGPLGPDLQDHLRISGPKLSVLVAVPVLLGSLMRIPLGLLAVRYGGRRVLAVLGTFSLVPLVALALFHDGYGAVLGLGFLLGFAGASFAVGVPFVSRWYPPERQGFALGVYGMGMGGTVLGGLTAPKISTAWGLAAPFWVAAGLLAVTLVVFVAFARETEDAPAPVPGAWRHAVTTLRSSGGAWALTLFYFLSFGGFVAMFLYLPKLLTETHHLTKTDAGARAAGFALLAVLARPAGGMIADRIGAERVLRWSFVATFVLALALAGGYENMPALTVACLLLAVALGAGTGAVFKLVAAWFPDQVGGVTGVVSAAGGLGGFFPPLVMAGVKSATGGFALGFGLLALVAAIAYAVLSRSASARTTASLCSVSRAP